MRSVVFALLISSQLAIAAGDDADFVGSERCKPCHAEEHALWQGSHHDLAMQTASEASVLGDFEDAALEHFGVVWRFRRGEGGRYLVRVLGKGEPEEELEVAYTFGVDPLQQYLVSLGGGRRQALSVAWDTRPNNLGGQRWFHLHPDEPVPAGDVLHWTGPAYRWNFMCADCHSTNLRKAYDLASDTYATTWSEIDVGCEACHGAASAHVTWAELPEDERDADAPRLATTFAPRDGRKWIIAEGAAIATLSATTSAAAEVATCAPCHSRRARIVDPPPRGGQLLNGYRPALLEQGLYHADGQILDEVFEWGSFVQSKMHRAGVVCSDCHDPHSLKLVAEHSQDVCAKCHSASVFDTDRHHHHAASSTGSRCVGCHMPSRLYMVIDERHDHGFRIPRPDLGSVTGSPDTCTTCHADQTRDWTMKAFAEWYPQASARRDFGGVLQAGRLAQSSAYTALPRLARDQTSPAIARATAIAMLPEFLTAAGLNALKEAVGDKDGMVRTAASLGVGRLPPSQRLPLLAPLLSDPLRGVRIQAAVSLADLAPASLATDILRILDRGLGEYRDTQMVDADRGSAHVNLGLLAASRGLVEEAAREYQTASRLEPHFIPAYVNLADLERSQHREADAEATLRRGLELVPDSAELHHALGLTLVRRGQLESGIDALRRATELAPAETRLAYVYAVALHSSGKPAEAWARLGSLHEKHPGHRDTLLALSTMARDAGKIAAAIGYAKKLVDLDPDRADARALLGQLEAAAKRQPER